MFVRDLMSTLTREMEIMARRAPDDWDGHELRVMIADHVIEGADPRSHQWLPARRKHFAKIVDGLVKQLRTEK